jgi:hypothetical protein
MKKSLLWNPNVAERTIPYLSLLVALLYLVVLHTKNEVPVDSGDGLAHFFIAQHVWTNPVELLNHWGKPLYTLFASPFAYFGFFSYIFFNLTVFAATCLVGFTLLTRFLVSPYISALLPFVLLSVPDYISNVLAGMTEPLFGLLALVAVLLLLDKKWLLFALLVSFAPFSRSEGQLLLVLAFLVLLWQKQWRQIPLLTVGFVIYSIIGWFAFDDFLWYFSHNPYRGAAEIYGQGNWTHYVLSWRQHLGFLGGIMLLAISIGSIAVWRKRSMQPSHIRPIVFALIAYFGILFTHAYLWANGKNGALGLSRLATHALPGLFCVGLLFINLFTKGKIASWSVAALLFLLSINALRSNHFPIHATENDKAIIESAKFIKSLTNNDKQIFYYHPLFALAAEVNLKDSKGKIQQRPFHFFEDELARMNNGDLIVWDSHFGPREMSLTSEKLEHLTRVQSFYPFGQYVRLNDQPFRVNVYQYFDTKKEPKWMDSTSQDTLISLTEGTEFATIARYDFSSLKTNEEKQLKIFLEELRENKDFFIIWKKESGQSSTYEINQSSELVIPVNSHNTGKYELFIHNPTKRSQRIKLQLEITTILLPQIAL